MTTNAPDYDALEAVVVAATPGPWEVDQPGRRLFVGNQADGRLHGLWQIVHMAGDDQNDLTPDAAKEQAADAAHIATFDPAMVADLLARARERDAAIAERDRLRDGIEALVQAATLADGDDPIGWVVTDNLRTLLDQTANDGNAT